MKRVGIMQPYFFPYLGYFQLINAVDSFVVYDNIEYTKRGWINRNAILVGGKKTTISINLKKAPDNTHIVERKISSEFLKTRQKLLRQLKSGYGRCAYFDEVYSLLEDCLLFETETLFDFLFHSINQVCAYLGIGTSLLVSSSLESDHELKGVDRVVDICRCLNASEYVNPEGGVGIYSKESFQTAGVDLKFLKMGEIVYSQGEGNSFVPRLSVIDLLMRHSKDEMHHLLTQYEFI